MRTMKITNPSEKHICFVTTTYADMFHRKAVTAYNAKNRRQICECYSKFTKIFIG